MRTIPGLTGGVVADRVAMLAGYSPFASSAERRYWKTAERTGSFPSRVGSRAFKSGLRQSIGYIRDLENAIEHAPRDQGCGESRSRDDSQHGPPVCNPLGRPGIEKQSGGGQENERRAPNLPPCHPAAQDGRRNHANQCRPRDRGHQTGDHRLAKYHAGEEPGRESINEAHPGESEEFGANARGFDKQERAKWRPARTRHTWELA